MSDLEETFAFPTPAEDAYPSNTYTITAPEDPVFFASQQIEPVTPAPEDPTVGGLVFYQTDIIPVPLDEREGLDDLFIPTDTNGNYVPPTASVTSLFPTNVPYEGGVVCTITGSNLNLAAYVRINARDLVFTYVDNNTITFVSSLTPDNTAGTKQIDVYDSYNALIGSLSITYDPQIATFGLTSATSSSGSTLGSQTFTIYGSALYYIQSVKVCNQPVLEYRQIDFNTLEVVTAPGEFTGIAGNIEVTNFDGVTAVLPNSYTYTYPAPFILGIDNDRGDVSGDTQVTIAGAYFNGVTSVTIGGLPVNFFMVTNSTQIIVLTAPGTYSGLALDLTVSSPTGSNTLPEAFRYTTTLPVPSVVSVSPPKGLVTGGTAVTVTGTNFNTATAVTLGGNPVGFTVVSDTKITFLTPVGVYSGNGLPVTVSNPDGSGSKNNCFTYIYDTPTVTSTTLTSDLVSGGTNGTIFGTNFYLVSSVTLAGVPVASFTVVSPTQIDYVTGVSPNDFTNGDIQVVAQFGIGVLSSVFTYTYPVVSISSLSVNAGFASGGATVVIYGTGFTLVTNVLVAGVAAASFTVDSLTQITLVTASNSFPTGLPGDVKVQTVFSEATLPNSFTYFPTMTLTSSSISTGVTTGGEVGFLYGANFANISTILLVGTAVASFTIVNSNTIQFTTGSTNAYGTLGTITIITAFGESVTLANAFLYYPALSIAYMSPATGLNTGGEVCTIHGTGFYDVQSVTIGGVAASFAVQSVSHIQVTTPASVTLGNVNVVVTTSNGSETLTNGFLYYPNMVVSSLDVSNGSASGGTTVVITGSGFYSVNSVTFNGVAVTSFVVNSLTQITCVTASKSLTDGDVGNVVVTSPYDSATLSNAWTYWPNMSVILLDQNNGINTGGTTVVIAGAGFYSVGSVTFNGVSVASFTVDSTSQITVVTSPGSNGTGDVVVTSSFTSATKTNAWTYWPTMAITTLSASNGINSGGTVVTVNGSGFFNVTAVSFNGVAATSFTVNSLNQLVATTAAKVTNGDVGNVVVTSTYTSATKSNAWTYWPPMSVSSLDVSNGSTVGGTTVVISGSGFYDISSITFNGVAVASFTVNSVTQITVTTGVGSTNGTGDVVVSSNFTSATGTNLWTYWQPVVVTSLSVTNGSTVGGTTVVITGSGYFSVTGVTFNGVAVTSYTVDSLTQITVTTASKVSNGDVGAVVVTTAYSSGTKSNAWTYWPPMSVSSLNVSNGSRVGGTTVVITGAGFYSVSGVTFNGDAVTSFTVDSVTQITVVTGAGSANGTGNVVVTSNFTSATGTNLWTYWPVMTVTSLDVSNGPRAGGTTVVITGTGFFSTINSITFNGVSVASYTVDSLTQITVITGPKVTSNGDVGNVVVTSIYTSATGTNLWTYYPPMSVTSLDVSNGPRAGGTTVVITGAGFYSVSGVTFNGIAVTSYTVDSVTQITVVTGPKLLSTGDLGNVVVTSNFTSATGTNLWTYYAPVVVSTLSVTNGSTVGGTSVVITGSGFYSVTGVTFNGVAVTSYTVDSLTQITVITGPKVTSNGDVGAVVVTTTYTSGTKSNAWTYWPPMSVTSLDVSNGPKAGGTTVVITGAGFYSVSGVTFTGIAVTSYTVDSVTQITVTTAAAPSVTAPSTGNVVVTSTFTSGTGTNLWTYYSPIVVSSLDVAVGNVSGGTTVNVTGTGFYGVNSVTFKGIEVLSKTVNSPTSITIVTKGDVIQLLTRLATNLNSPFAVQNFSCWAGGTINKFIVSGTNVYTCGGDGVSYTAALAPNNNLLRYPLYVPSLGKVYVVGNGNFSDRFIESSDGITWTSPGVLPINNNWNWMAYSPTLDMFVVVARAVIATPLAVSTDRGATWTLRGTGTARSFGTVTWCSGFGKFVANGFTTQSQGIIAYSSDGITWTEVDLSTQLTGDVQLAQSAAYSEDTNTLLVCGVTYTFTTTDGMNWSRSPLTINAVQPHWVSSLGVFVAHTDTDQFSYSADGLNWNTITSTDSSGVAKYGLAWSAEYDSFFVSPTAAMNGLYTFTNPENATGSVVVTSTYTSGTKSNCFTFSPKIAIGDVDIGYGPTVGGTTVKIYGRGFRDVSSVTLKGVAAASFTVSTDGTVITAVTAAGTAGTGDIVVSSTYRTSTFTNGWSYKNVSTPTYIYGSLSSGAKSNLIVALNMRPVLSTYSGPLFRVIRSSDRAITDVYGTSGSSSSWFTKNGIDLSTWKSTNTLYVVRWFDQSGSTLSTDTAVPKPPGSGGVFAYMYSADKMPVLDTTANCIDFNAANRYMQMANSTTAAVTSPYTMTIRHGTVGNATNGSEFFNIGTNSNTPPGSGNYFRRSGNNYINTWPGNGSLTLSNKYAANQVVSLTYDLTSRRGFVQSSLVSSLASVLAGTSLSVTIGGRGNNTTIDSLAQFFSFNATTSVYADSDRLILEENTDTPVVASTSVSNGVTTGGTTVVLTGTGFLGVTNISFNGVNASSFTIDSSTQITAVTGAAVSTGVGDIVLTKATGNGTATNAWTYWPPMSVSSLNVSNGSRVGGTTVVITGAGFYSVSGVTFNGDAVSSFTVDSVTQITVVTGAGSANGTGNVVVTSNFTSATGTNLWTYWPVMSVTSLDVTQGSFVGGTTVNLTGTGFWNVSGITVKGVSVRSFTVNSETSATIVTDSNMVDLMNTWTTANIQNIFSSYFWGPLEYSSASGEAIFPTSTSTATVTTARICRSDTTRSTMNTTENNRWGHVIYVPQISKYVAVSFQASTSNYVATSADGITWTPKAGQAGSWIQVVYAPSLNMLVAISNASASTQAVMTSTDGGDTWTLQTTPTIAGSSWRSITWSPTLSTFLAVGHNGNFSSAGIGIAMTSTDGTTWTQINWDTVVPKITGRGSQAFSVDWSEDLQLFCVIGNVSSYSSPDAVTWLRGDVTPYDMSSNYVKYVSDIKRFVCNQTSTTTDLTKIRWSSDGINWTAGSITSDQITGWTYMPNRKTFVVKNNQGLLYRVAQPAVATGNVVVTSAYTSATKSNGFSYVPEVFIEGVQTAYGSTTGGSSVIIEGGGFTSVTAVTIGGTAVTSYTVDSTKQITAVVPAGTLGAKNIVVTTSFGSATLTNGFRYIAVPTPVQYTLDNVSVTSIQYAFANRLISSTYTGPIFIVRKSTDNKWTRVYDQLITDSGETLTTWLGGATAFVIHWYDQSGLGQNAYTYILPNQPSLNASTGLVDMTDATNTQFLTINAGSASGNTPYSMVVRHGVTNAIVLGDYLLLGTASATAHSVILRRQGSSYRAFWYSTGLTPFTSDFGTYANGSSISITYDLTDSRGYVNGVLKNTQLATSPVLNVAASASYIQSNSGNRARAEYYCAYAFANVITDTERVWLEADGVDLTISSTSVSNGTTAGGTTVVITGTGFYGVDTVSFAGVNAASFTIDSPTQITAVTASNAVGVLGDIVVSSPIDSATSTNGWAYYPPMSFTSIDVASGLNSGGTAVVITGAGFYAVSSVTFGGTAVASFTVDSLTQITVSTGVSSVTAPTLGNVVVTSPYTSTTGTNVFTYYPPVVVSSLDVSYGPVSGGTTVNITGSGFHNVNSVTFKNIEVLSKTVNSPTSITVVVKGDVAQLVGRNSWMGSSAPTTNFIAASTFHCWAGGSIQKWIVPGTYIYTSSDSVTFTVADVPTPGSYRYAMYVPSLSKAFVIGNGNFADRFIESTDGITWTSPGVLPVNRSWNWAAYSPTLDVFVVVERGSANVTPIAVSTDRGATWTTYGTGTARSFGTVVWCTAIGKFVASGINNISPGIIAHSSDGITWTEVDLATVFPSVADVGIRQTCSVSEDLGIVWFCSATNSFTWDGTTWQTGTSSVINNPVWVPSVYAFVGVVDSTTYAYSANGLVWTNVSVNSSGAIVYGSFAYSPELDVFLATGTGSSYNFTNPNISTNNSVVVTSTYTSGTKTNAWAFVPTMAISDVDIGYGPTAGGTVVKIYGRGFRNINPGSVTFKGVQATSFTTDSNGCLITATVAAGTAGTGNIVCANSFRTATLTNGWSYKNTSVSSYALSSLSSGALSSVKLVCNTKPVLSTYSGPLFRVWRDSDGAWTDVYATSGSSTDWFTKNGIALSTFKGSATLRVVRWFDQSGNTAATDGHIPKPPNSGGVFGYNYQIRYMPTLDPTNNCLDFSGGSRFLQVQNGVTTAGDVSHTITVRHGTTGNSVSGEYFNIGTNTATPPGDGNYLRRSGSDYLFVWPGNNTLALTGAYADNQVVTTIYDQSGLLRTGFVQGTSAGTSVVSTAFTGSATNPFIGGRGSGAIDSLAQLFHFHVASSAFNSSDRAVFEDLAASALPVVTSVNVPSGTTAGGTTVVITGTGFLVTTGVSFNGVAAASFTIDSATQITAVTAAGTSGRGDVVVTKSSGTSTFTNGWTYVDPTKVYSRYPAVTDISTTTGLNKSASSWLTTVTYSSALNLFVVADGNASGITQPYVTSADGTTWTRQTAPAAGGNDSINDIAASPTAIVSVGVLPLIRRSTNATTWTNVTGSNTLTFRVAYSPSLSRWAVGRGNTNGLYYSNNDGATWTAATGAAVFVANVLWNSTLNAFYVFMRNGGSVYSSSNGTAYSLAANNVLTSDNYHAAAFSSDRNEMVTIGNYSANVYTSTNGTTWTLASTITGTQVVGVTWSTELYMYVACTNKGLYASADATTWIPLNPITWSGTFDFSWGRWVYSPSARKGVAAYVNTVFRTEDTTRGSISFAANQNVQITNDADLRPGTGDFTVEWFQLQTTPTTGTTPYTFSIGNDLALTVNGTSGVFSVFVGGSAVLTTTPTNVFGRWCHFAVTRTGTTLGIFKDGNRLTTVTNSTNITNSTDALRIGNSSTTSSSNQYLGLLTNFHFVKGTALYTTATYTVPTREVFATTNSKLLLPARTGSIVGNYSGVAKTITNNSATASTFSPFFT